MHVGRVRETNRAGQVARLIDFQNRQTTVLFVIRAQPAIERATVLRPSLRRERTIPRLEPRLLRLPIFHVVADLRLLHAVLAASLQVPNAALFDKHLRGHEPQAGLTQTRCLTVKEVRRPLPLEGTRCRLARRDCHR